jgi:uncharacterized protein (TIGR02996 family)
MADRPWYDQRLVHEPLRADQHRDPCAVCGRYTCECIPDYFLKLKNEEPFASDLSTPRGTTEERAFFSAIESGPAEDRTPRLVFADWLDEHGRTDEGATLRDGRVSPVITPFRILPYWRAAPFFARLLKVQTRDPEMRIVRDRLMAHDQFHGAGFRAAIFPRLLMLRDDEAVLAGIDLWPLQPGEPEAIVRVKTRRDETGDKQGDKQSGDKHEGQGEAKEEPAETLVFKASGGPC